MVRSRLILLIHDETLLQKKLITVENLDLKKTEEMCRVNKVTRFEQKKINEEITVESKKNITEKM